MMVLPSLAAESAHDYNSPTPSINQTHPPSILLLSTAKSALDTKALSDSGLQIVENGHSNSPKLAIDGITQSLRAPTGSFSKHRDYTENKTLVLAPSNYHHKINLDVSVDVEKQSSSQEIYQLATDRHSLNDHDRTTIRIPEEVRSEDLDPAQHAAWVLLYLSVLSPIFTLLICLYSILVIGALLLLTPCYLCTAHEPVVKKVSDLLLPLLRLQLRLIYSPTESAAHGRLSMLILISLGSPVYSIGIAIGAWVAAAFWAYASILGDPDGSDQHNDDGREAVLRVRRWWQRWLERAII